MKKKGIESGRVASVGMGEKAARCLSIFIHIQYIFGSWNDNVGLDVFSFSKQKLGVWAQEPTWAQEVNPKFWCTFPPSPLFVLLRFPSHTHWVSVHFTHSTFYTHTHTHSFHFIILFSFLRHDVIARCDLWVCVCVCFVHLFILQYLSGAKVFLFIFDVTVYVVRTCCCTLYSVVLWMCHTNVALSVFHFSFLSFF